MDVSNREGEHKQECTSGESAHAMSIGCLVNVSNATGEWKDILAPLYNSEWSSWI